MKPTLLIASLAVPLYLTACDVRKSESTGIEPSPKDVPAETVVTEEAAADGAIPGEAPVEAGQERGEVSGALIGAAAGGIIGHQSGSALEGAAIGAAAGEIEYQPQPEEVEEE
jgi:hypothetical protein